MVGSNVMVRTGGGYMPLDDWLAKFGAEEIRKQLRAKRITEEELRRNMNKDLGSLQMGQVGKGIVRVGDRKIEVRP